MTLEERCQPIELVLADVDGVLTDGHLDFDNQGIETKRFHIRDGLGIKLWQKAGYRFGIITTRSSQMVKQRAGELDIEIVRQGAGDKLATAQEILSELKIAPQAACYIGDDLPDMPVARTMGLGVAVADACLELREVAHYVTTAAGGQGAVREVIEMILRAQRRWDDVIQTYRV
ncbi:MAG: HAD hydrolase family protein [Pirellulales bacterium]|nr:HAD hydrolase family protein [Pirellulales bacterium]